MERLLHTLVVIAILVIGASLADLPGLSASANRSEFATSAMQTDPSGWRRTTRGWEHESVWSASTPTPVASPPTNVNPLVVGSLQLLVAIAALRVWPPKCIA
jgi:hypothetical protein